TEAPLTTCSGIGLPLIRALGPLPRWTVRANPRHRRGRKDEVVDRRSVHPMMLDFPASFPTRGREQRAQHMLRRVVDASPDVIYVYHVPWRRIAFLGQRVREVLGFAAARSHRLRVGDFEGLVHLADLAGFRKHLAAVEQAAEGEILTHELRIKGADGRYRWL